jgi:thiamine-phosphate pyrophosphorylase
VNVWTLLQRVHKPILCYVTEQRALRLRSVAASYETGTFPTGSLREVIRRAAAAGVDWIQIREKDLATRPLVELVRLAISDTRGSGTKILVNDRLDVALCAGAAGVHLGETSLPVEAVAQRRRSSSRPDFLIGASCHSPAAARAAEIAGADYIFFGPVFATPAKAVFGPPQGIPRLREVCGAVQIPVLAIGGITIENAALCRSAGAQGVAAIRLFQEFEDLTTIVARLRE